MGPRPTVRDAASSPCGERCRSSLDLSFLSVSWRDRTALRQARSGKDGAAPSSHDRMGGSYVVQRLEPRRRCHRAGPDAHDASLVIEGEADR